MKNIKHKRSKTILISFVLLSFLLFLGAFTKQSSPVGEVKDICLTNTRNFSAQLDTFQFLIDDTANADALLERFIEMRNSFKKIEFILEYYDNNRYPFFNGANAIEMEYGYDPNLKPEGLQVVESELFADSIDYESLTQLTRKLKYRTLAFYLILKNATLKDTYIFEAIRFHLIRIETLSLVSFDSPDLRNITPEIEASLKTIQHILSLYHTSGNDKQFKQMQASFDATNTYLNKHTFSTIDRLYFIKKYLQPLNQHIVAFQAELNIPNLQRNEVFRAVNLDAKTIYDTDFLDAKFYASDKYYPNNPLYSEIGKKLFFDTRLSKDGKMSCATCHQPEKFFTDKLKTAITNKPDKFQERNTPTLLNAALQASYFYDLRAVTLETQVDQVVSNPEEFNHDYTHIVKELKADTTYIRLFNSAFPQYKENAIALSTINLCISDFERQLIFLNSPFDKYMRGETKKIDAAVKRGFNVFMGKGQCGSCHFAPTFFGNTPPFYGVAESEVLGVTQTFDTIHPVLDTDIGKYKIFEIPDFKHSIKTSTVRNIDITAPYMHNGGFKTLEEVIEFYEHGGGLGLRLDIPNQTLQNKRLHLTDQEKKDLIAFMKALTDTSGIKRFYQ
ncbi:MAG: hypothetical protein KDD21_00255 [Bacteroidetes bacterium]|nr:hypothetical protein [Bacteroidota bacterium]